MKIMDSLGWNEVTDDRLNFFKATGVDCLQIVLSPEMSDGQDHTEDFKGLKSFVEAHGLELHVLRSDVGDRVIYDLPGRDEQIDNWCEMLRAIGAVGVPKTAMTFFAISHFRTDSSPGRGGSSYSSFNYEEFMKDPPRHPGKQITADRLWENLTYFLERVIPVAEEAGVKIAVHPDDPPIPEALGGADRIVVSVENYQRMFDIFPSENIGMLFCQGCVAEMGVDVVDTIRYMGERDKIFYVHFRNIRGTPYDFQEVFIDEGEVDMLKAMEAYRDVGFNGPFMMDHTPHIQYRSGDDIGHAYANGYIRALIQTVYR